MAAQATDSSSRPPHAYTIGYAMLPNKRDTFVQPSFLDMAAQHGIRLVAIDASRPLVEQRPFDLVVHKLYDQAWRAQLEAFSALHPDVPVVDPPAAIDPILDRSTMLDVISGLSIDASGSQEQGVPSVGIPRQVVVNDAADLDDPAAAAAGDLRFPLIAKPVVVDGSAASHDLCLVFRREGLRGLHAPLVIQEFVNHGGMLFKVYVVGDHATCVTRSSLPDVPDERLHDATAPAAVPFANVSLLPPPAAAGDNSATKMPPADFINKVARELRRALGLHLINFDLIRATGGKYFIVDINYCPGYSKMPGFEPVLTEFFLEMLRARPVREEQRRPVSGQEAEVPIVPKKGIELIPGPSEAGLGQVQA